MGSFRLMRPSKVYWEYLFLPWWGNKEGETCWRIRSLPEYGLLETLILAIPRASWVAGQHSRCHQLDLAGSLSLDHEESPIHKRLSGSSFQEWLGIVSRNMSMNPLCGKLGSGKIQILVHGTGWSRETKVYSRLKQIQLKEQLHDWPPLVGSNGNFQVARR